MELTTTMITAAVTSMLFFWFTLYNVMSIAWPQKSPEWNCRMVTFVHATAIVIMSYVFGFHYNPWPFTHPGGKSTLYETLTIVICLGYFLFDFGWCVWYFNSESATMLAHHVLSIGMLLMALGFGVSGTEVGATIFGSEMSNPMLQLRYFMKESGWKDSYLYEVNDLVFMLTFFVCRACIGSYFLYCELTHPRPRLGFKIGAIGLYLVSWVFLVNIFQFAVHKYRKMFLAWRKKRHLKMAALMNGNKIIGGLAVDNQTCCTNGHSTPTEEMLRQD
ncbi:TLC domain-containing protein 5-like [Amphiura filiformis]|uniref:TLC domain-containing protein 5-like n=1 Tax=Amphiura filiformis TaxID=82378 RepID=UPI003B2233F5